MKEKLIGFIERKVVQVQGLDQIVIPEVQQCRQNYSNEEVFSRCLDVLLEAAKGVGAIEFLENNYSLDLMEMARIQELKESYLGLRTEIYGLYQAHYHRARTFS